jgi:hypothetical protein
MHRDSFILKGIWRLVSLNKDRCKSFGCGGPCRESTCNIHRTVTMLPLAVARSLPNHLQLCRVTKLSAQISEGFKYIHRSNTSRAYSKKGLAIIRLLRSLRGRTSRNQHSTRNFLSTVGRSFSNHCQPV